MKDQGVVEKNEEHQIHQNDEEPKKLKYPKSIFFIFSNEFCERFSYYGMRTVLALYLQSKLGYSEDNATFVYHVFVMLCYFTPLIGGIMADSWLGKYRTILYVSIMYAIGNIALSAGALPEQGVPHVWLSLLGLFLIATGTGGIKPCVSSFGGDQFIVPEQKDQLDRFFSIFYFSVNAGSVLSCFFTPVLREVKCLGQDDCYPLAFGVPAVLMVLSIVFFVLGKPMYRMVDPEDKNIVVEVTKVMSHAIVRKVRTKNKNRSHWLDYADDKYDRKLIEDVKILMKIVILFTPTIVFWSLYEQQGSRWTFQAGHMDGRVGSFVVEPDQMQTLNAVLVLAFIPIFEVAIYPALNKLRIIRTSLQKLSWGGFIGALSFVIAGIVQLYMQPSYPVFPEAGQSQLRVFNSAPCQLSTSSNESALSLSVAPYSMWQDLDVKMSTPSLDLQVKLTCDGVGSVDTTIQLNNGKASYYLASLNGSKYLEFTALEVNGYSELDKLDSGYPKMKLIYTVSDPIHVVLRKSNEKHSYRLTPGLHQTDWNTTTPIGKYSVTVERNKDRQKLNDVNLEPGGVYIMMMTSNNTSTWGYSLFTITPPNNISMMWQTPQYIAITFAEILFSITGIEFAYTQSPKSMKSIISSLWLITDSFGNVIVLVVAELKIFSNQAYEFFLFAGLMAAVMIIFVIMAVNYKYVQFDQNGEVIVTKNNQEASDPSKIQESMTSA